MNQAKTNINVKENDSDPEGGVLNDPSIVSNVKRGALTSNGNGTFNYTPAENFVGVDQFSYRVCNAQGVCDTAIAYIMVFSDTVCNHYIKALPDNYTVAKFDTLKVVDPNGILKNDNWPNGQIPGVTVVTPTDNGTLSVNSDGTFTYIPNLHYSGPDVFSYRLCTDSPTVECDTAWVNIFVTERPCPDPVNLALINDTLPVCATDSIDLNTFIDFVASANLDTVYFYSDGNLQDTLTGSFVKTQGWYYIQADNIYTCSVYDSVYVIVNPVSASGLLNGATTVCASGNSTQLTLTGKTGNVIKWQQAASPFIDWSDILITDTAYLVANLTATTQYRVIVQSGVCLPDTSSIATITVDSASKGGVLSKDTTICSGGTVNLVLTGYTGNIVRWEYAVSPFNGWVPIANTNETLTTEPLTATRQYRVVVQNGVCPAVNSDTAIITVKQIATDLTITASNMTVCTGTDVMLTATSTVVANPGYTWYTDQTTTDTLATGSSFNVGILTTNLTHDTVFYVSVGGSNYCENLQGTRKAVTVNIRQMPVLELTAPYYTLCGKTRFDSITATVTGSSDGIASRYEWQRYNFSTKTYASSGNFAPSISGNITNINQIPKTTYLPSTPDGDTIILKMQVNTNICGWISDSVILYKNANNPAGTIEIVSQPEGKQEACVDTVYIVKITDAGTGGLTNINVVLWDWIATGLQATDIAYTTDEDYANTTDWVSLTRVGDSVQPAPGQWSLIYDAYIAAIPDTIKIENGNSMYIRYTVSPECEFYAGGGIVFLLNGTDVCHSNNVKESRDTSDIFEFDWGDAITLVQCGLESIITPDTVNNQTLGKMTTWKVKYWLDDVTGNVFNPTDSIYFVIPPGTVLKDSVIRATGDGGFYNDVKPRRSNHQTNIYPEFIIPVVSTLSPGDTVEFEFDILVTGNAFCGMEDGLYMEIIYKGTKECRGQNCNFYQTEAGSYPTLTIDWYDYVLADNQGNSYGVMKNEKWTGSFMLTALDSIIGNDQDTIYIDFYVDLDNDGYLTEDLDSLVHTFKIATKTSMPSGTSFPLYITDSIPTVEGYQLLARTRSDILCSETHIPIATLFGEDRHCQNDTIVYVTAPDKGSYIYKVMDAITGATPLTVERLPLEGNSTWAVSDSAMRVVFKEPGNYKVQVQYNEYANTSNERTLNPTQIFVGIIPKPYLALTGLQDTTVCEGSSTIELSHFFQDTVSANAGSTILNYERKESDGSYTLIGSGSPFFVAPLESITYRISATSGALGCNSVDTLEFTVNVSKMPQIANVKVHTQPTCQDPAGSIQASVVGGSGIYKYSLNNEAGPYADLPVNGIIGNLPVGDYTVYIKDTVQKGCAASISGTVSLNAYNSGLSVIASADTVETCSDTTGVIRLTVNGGAWPYQYKLDNGNYTVLPASGIIDSVTAGSHSVTVMDATGCTATAGAVRVNVRNGVGIDLTQITAAACDSTGWARITASNGIMPYSYRVGGKGWVEMNGTTDSTRLLAGIHEIFVKDSNNCESSSIITIENTDSDISLTLNDITDALCNGTGSGSISITAAGKAPLYYSLDGGNTRTSVVAGTSVVINDLSVGQYSIMLFDKDSCVTVIDKILIDKQIDFIQANDDRAVTYINQSVNGNILDNDYDYNYSVLTRVSSTAPLHGTITIAANGAYVYSPATGFIGKDSVRYAVKNACGLMDSAWLHIEVLLSVIPDGTCLLMINNDNGLTKINQSVVIPDVISNDRDLNGGALSIPTIVDSTLRGTLTNNGDGSFTYKPDSNFVGTDKFTYRVCNSTIPDCCDTATVLISVWNEDIYDTTIIAEPDLYIVAKYDTLKMPAQGILTNDHYPSGTPVINIAATDSTQHGKLTINQDGSFIYLPDLGYSGSDGFTYTLCVLEKPTLVCAATYVTIIVTERACPDTVILEAKDTLPICQGAMVDLNTAINFNTSQNFDTVYFYSDRGFTNNITANPIVGAQGYYYIKADNKYACSVYDSVYVNVNPLPTVAIIGGNRNVTLCARNDSTFNLKAMAIVTASGDSLQFSRSKNFVPLIPTILTVNIGTRDSVYVRAFNSQTGCASSVIDSIKFTLNRLPQVTLFTGTDSVCLGSSVTINNPCPVNSNCNWVAANSTVINLVNPNTNSVDVKGLAFGTSMIYHIAIDNITGCRDTAKLSFKVNPLPLITAFGAPDSVCFGITKSISNACPVNATCTWVAANGNVTLDNPQGNTVNVTGATVGDVMIYHIAVDNISGCVDTAKLSFKVNGIPTLIEKRDTTICTGQSVDLNVLVALNANTSATFYNAINGTLINPAVVSPTDTTKYYILVTNQTTTCASWDSLTVNVNPLPALLSKRDTTICNGQSVDLNVLVTVGTDTTVAFYTSVNGTLINPAVVSPTDTTKYYILVTNQTTTCTSWDSLTVNVNPLPALLSKRDTTICNGQSMDLNVLVTVGTDTTVAFYTSVNGTLINSAVVSPTDTTKYYILVTNQTTTCTSWDSLTVNVNPLPALLSKRDTTICNGQSVDLNVLVTLNANTSATFYNAINGTAINPATVSPAATTKYYILVTNQITTCTSWDSLMVNVTPVPALLSKRDTTICTGQSVDLNVLVTLNANTSATFYNAMNGTAINPATVSPAATTKYYVLVSSTATTCASWDSLSVNVTPVPALLSKRDTTVCNGQSVDLNVLVTLNANTSATFYNAINGTVINPATVSPIITTKYYILVSSTATTCASWDSLTVNVTPVPALLSKRDTTICNGQSVDLNVLVTLNANTSATFYNAMNGTVINPATVSPAATTKYYILVSSTTTTCASWDSLTVNVNPLPALLSKRDTTICNGQSVDLNVLVTLNANTSATFYNAINGTVINPATVSPAATTKYYVLVSSTATTCTSWDSLTVNVNAAPALLSKRDTTICNGQSVDLNVLVTLNANTSATFYNAINGTAINPATVSPVITTKYYILVTNQITTCTSWDSLMVNVNAAPALLSKRDTTICNGKSVDLNVLVTLNANTSATFYNAMNGTVINPATVSPATTTKYYILVGSTATTCTSWDSLTVNVNAKPEFSFADMSVCAPNSIDLRSLRLQSGDTVGLFLSYYDNTYRLLSNPVASVSGVYHIIGENTNGCSDTSTVTATINPTPSKSDIISATGDTICSGRTATLHATATANNTPVWYRNSALTDSVGEGNTFITPVLTVSTAYYVVARNANGCQAIEENATVVTVKVNTAPVFVTCPENITVTIQGDQPDTTVVYTATVSGVPSPALTYIFSGATTGSGTGTGSGSVFEKGITTVKIFATNTCGIDSCIFTVAVKDVINPCDSVSATLSGNISICEGSLAMLTVVFTGTGPWNIIYTDGTNEVDLTNITQNPLRISVKPDYSTTYSLVEVSAGICIGTVRGTATVTVNPIPALPLLQISGDTLINSGTSTTLTVVTPVNGTIRWYGDIMYNTLLQQGNSYTTPLLYNDTSYYLRLISDKGCESATSQRVNVKIKKNCVLVPEAITPNGDGVNDYLIISCIENYPNNRLFIYNRWSNLIFETKGYNNQDIKWDGYSNQKLVVGGGKKVPTGTYFYILELNDKEKTVLKGFIEVRY